MNLSSEAPQTLAQQFYRPLLIGTAGTACARLHNAVMCKSIASLGCKPEAFTLPLAFANGCAWGLVEFIGIHMALETITLSYSDSPSQAVSAGLAYWVTRAIAYNGAHQLANYLERPVH